MSSIQSTIISHRTRQFEAERPQHAYRLWNGQSNAREGTEVRGQGVLVERTHDESEKDIEFVLRKVVAAQLAKADGAQKRSRSDCRTEMVAKKARRAQSNALVRQQDHTEYSSSRAAVDAGSRSPSITDSDAADCIVVGQGEMSPIEFRGYMAAQPPLSHIEQPLERHPTAPKQDRNFTSSHTEAPTESSQTGNPLPTHRESSKDFSGDQGTACKAHKALLILDKADQERGDCENRASISKEEASTDTIESSLPQSTTLTHQDLTMITCHPQPPSKNILDITSSEIKRLPIAALLNESTSPAGRMHPPAPTVPKTTSSGPPSSDTSLGNVQDDVSAGLLSDTKSLMPFRRKPSNITMPLEDSASYDHKSRASEPALVRRSDFESASRRRSDKMLLDKQAVAQGLARRGKILMPQSSTPDSWIMLSIDTLLSQNPLGFFRTYSKIAGAGEVLVLSFGLPDVTWQQPKTENISRGDSDAFYSLKRTVWDCFCMFLMRCPDLTVFRVMVSAPAGHTIDDTVAIPKCPGNKIECGSISESLTRLAHRNPTATSNTELVRLPPSASHPYVSITHDGHKPTPRSSSTGPPTQKKHPTTELLTALTSGWNLPRRASHNIPPVSQITTAPQDHHPPAIPARMAHRQDNPAIEASSAVQIVIRIQENEHGQFSRHYDQTVLLSEITTVNFFAWFARSTGYAHPLGPVKLKITLKDALPIPVHGKIRRGDEGHFELIKRDIQPHLERAKILMPQLTEFAILVTVPGWSVE